MGGIGVSDLLRCYGRIKSHFELQAQAGFACRLLAEQSVGRHFCVSGVHFLHFLHDLTCLLRRSKICSKEGPVPKTHINILGLGKIIHQVTLEYKLSYEMHFIPTLFLG